MVLMIPCLMLVRVLQRARQPKEKAQRARQPTLQRPQQQPNRRSDLEQAITKEEQEKRKRVCGWFRAFGLTFLAHIEIVYEDKEEKQVENW